MRNIELTQVEKRERERTRERALDSVAIALVECFDYDESEIDTLLDAQARYAIAH